MFGGQGDNSALFNDLHMYDIGMFLTKKIKEKEKREEKKEKKIPINN